MSNLRKILHVDMDAFYASIEQRDYPAYRGKPLAVGGSPEKRGAVAAASYEARQYGVHSALPSRIAAQRCPDLIFVRPRFEIYKAVSRQIRDVFLDYTDLVEPLSLDEAYLDVTENKLGLTRAITVAQQIKQRILETTQLTASAGVSVNKFLSKMASGMNKPDGLTVILPEQAVAFVAKLPIEKFHGVGPATARKMKQLNIHTGADLKTWGEDQLVAQFGKVGYHYYRIARGQDHRLVNPNRIRKSIGSEHSFAEDLADLGQMKAALASIAEEVATRLQKANRMGYTLTLKVKYANYQQITRSHTVTDPLQSVADLLPLSEKLLTTHLERGRQVRLLGLTVSNLAAVTEPLQLPLPGL